MLFPQSSRNWYRALFERGCLLGWMVLMTVNTVLIGWALELFVVGTVFSFCRILLLNEQTVPFLLYGIIAIFNFAIMKRLHTYGVENLNFELHEHAFNKIVEPPASWSSSILELLDERTQRSNELEMLVRHIEEALGPVERQDRRAEAKAWLKVNRDKLTEEDHEYAREHLGYLHLS